MDLPTFLAVIVAALIVLSGYFLFNDATQPRSNGEPTATLNARAGARRI